MKPPRVPLLPFAAAAFAGSMLLFLVEPLVGRMLLPRAGGAPAVWLACMLFFQVVLLAGYVYVHVVAARFARPRQLVLHGGVAALSLLALPIALPTGWAPPPGAFPVPSILGRLLLTVGLPFFLLSTTAPLVQRWFAATPHPAAADPYFLYAASNLGSFAGLLAYPFLLEPFLGVRAQGRLWAAAYVGFLAVLALCAWTARAGAGPEPRPARALELLRVDRRALRWAYLAAVPSALLLTATGYLTGEVAPVPLLWVAPLALYLLTFVAAFARRLRLDPGTLAAVQRLPAALVGISAALALTSPLVLLAHLAFFACTALLAHAELARRRPPAAELTRFYVWVGVGGALRQGGGSTARDGAAPRMALVGAQVALALAFLVASGLTLESFRRTLAVPLGYRPDGLLAVNLTLDPIRARNEPADALWRAVLDEVRAVPGVRAVALGECSPLGDHCEGTGIEVAGRVGSTHVMLATAAPGYFETLGTRLVRGRDFRPADGTSAERVMIINREAARLGWGGEDPLATPAVWGGGPVRVVGIVEDARYGDVEEPARPAIFLPFGERTRGVVFVRTDRDAASLVAPLRAAIHRAGAGNAPGEVRTMTSQLREATVRERLGAQVFTGFALCALLLAAVGVYGTAALALLQRGREFAIRRALGASAASLVRVVARDTARVIAGGGVAGVVLALAVGRELSGVLRDVSAGEPRVYATSVLLLLGVVIAASAVPTARSVRVDPRVAMRAE